jgi:helicase SWR1
MDKAVESGDGISAEARETVNRLHVILRPFILRRLKAEVEKQLPAKVEHTVYCSLSKRQQYLYDEFMSRSSTRHSLVNGGYLGIANCLMQLRKVCNHPDLFEVRPIATSFAMQQSVVSSFRGTFAALDGIRNGEAERLHLKEFDYFHGPSTKAAAEAISRLDATVELPSGETKTRKEIPIKDTRTVEGWKVYQAYRKEEATASRWQRIRDSNRQRCNIRPVIDDDTLRAVRVSGHQSTHDDSILSRFTVSNTERLERTWPLIQQFAVIPPKATALEPTIVFSDQMQQRLRSREFHAATDILHSAAVKLQIAFPDKTLLQYDCGKLQKLAEMLKNLQVGGHRVLIFTQMTKMLDILETFLSHAGYRYSRLDGSTKIEDRLLITERFNNNPRIFAFIASTRSGGVGINLTGADTVIFYDNEFNPAMDKQAMDRAHRIGQTREVHIYRLVTRHTVEENMLKKANQKRLLDDVVMQEGNFTTDYLTSTASKGKNNLRDMLGEDVYRSLAADGSQPSLDTTDVRSRATSVGTSDEREMQNALEQVQDTEDIEAGREAAKEIELEDTDFATDFDKNGDGVEPEGDPIDHASRKSPAAIAVAQLQHNGDGENSGPVDAMQDQDAADADLDEDEHEGALENWMLRVVEEDWNFFDS